MILFWILIFILCLMLLVKGSDWLVEGAEAIGKSLGMSPFIIGITIVGIGTSLPELIVSISATIKGVSDIAIANAVGSNITNILLIAGLGAIISKNISFKKINSNLDIPLLSLSTVLLIIFLFDQSINLIEGAILLTIYILYILSLYFIKKPLLENKEPREPVTKKSILITLIGFISLMVGAEYLVMSVVEISTITNIAVSAIALSAIAIGTSLPELFVSIRAAKKNKPEIALGNILGSNLFNTLVVVGGSSLAGVIVIDPKTFLIGLPVMTLATILFIIFSLTKQLRVLEGVFYVLLYLVFIGLIF